MKRNFPLTLLLTLLLVSCAKKEWNGDESIAPSGVLNGFSASIKEEYGESKALVDLATRKVSFENGDEITVSNGSQSATYTYNSQDEKFYSDEPLSSASSYTAFYPASAFQGIGADGSLLVDIPAQKEYNAAFVSEAPMGAVSDGSTFAFKNLCAIIKFSLSTNEMLTRATFLANVPLCGAATFKNGLLTMDENGGKEISITLPTSFRPDEDKPFCLVIPAGTYTDGFCLKNEFSSGRVWYQTSARTQVIAASTIYVESLFELGYFSGGKGTAVNPYIIASRQDLLDLSTRVSGTDEADLAFRTAHYRQMADIDFAGGTLNSIGNSNADGGCYFEGTYDGNGFTISNLNITNPNTDKAVGFFGYLNGTAKVKGMRIDRAGVQSATWNNGVIVGCMQPGGSPVVEDCIVTNSSVQSNNSDNGGIVGKMMSGTIRNCSFSGTVTGTGSAKHQCGGIVGEVTAAGNIVENCRFSGTVKGACGNVGGIAGSSVGSAFVRGCQVETASLIEGGSIADNGINIGGIVGYINSATGGRVENCSCAATVKAHYYDIGGIVGRNQGLLIKNCSFTGTVSSDYSDGSASDEKYGRLGGICGHIHGTGVIEGCQVSGNVGAATCYAGGVCGWLELGSISGCSISNLTLRGASHIGGIVGRFKSGIVKSCTLTGLTLTATGNFTGGAVGSMVPGASLSVCTLTSSTITGNMAVGGMCGFFNAGGLVSQCQTSGCQVIAATKLAGGIVGNIDSSTDARQSRIEKCVVEGGRVQGTTGLIGGILGGCNTYGIINLCTASCRVNNTGSGSYGSIGGIAGWISSANTLIANCVYYGEELHNDSGTSGGVGGICGTFTSSTLGNTAIVNCCSFATRLSTGGTSNANIAGIAGLVNTTTIRNCYSPTPASVMFFNGAASGSSRGSIYGWLRGQNTTDACSGILENVYWLSGFKAGNFSGNYTYVKSEQALTDAQMQNNGAVSRPSTGTAYPDFISALNAAADTYNNAPTYDIRAEEWVMGSNNYPVPYGTALAVGTPTSGKKRVSLLGDSITTYKGYTLYPGNGQYPNSNYSDFTSVTMTYWYQLIYQKMNALLEVNSAFTGTCVQDNAAKGHPGYGFLQRYVDLGHPDIILINGGTNDAWSYSLPVGSLDFDLATDALDTYQFAQAYDKLIRLIQAKYPSAKIACIIGDNVMDSSKTAYAQVIRDVCNHYDLPYAEVVFADRTASTYDKVHPNVAGMADMANQIYTQLKNKL